MTDIAKAPNPVCDVPNDGPVVFLTRDILHGVVQTSVEVWIRKPRRHVNTVNGSIMWLGDEGLLGSFTDEAVRERFNFVPGADECVVLDNAKVN